MAQHHHQGFLRVSLYIGDEKYRNFRVDYLVLAAFDEPRPSLGYKAVHLDEDNHNNHLSNLKWELRKKRKKG